MFSKNIEIIPYFWSLIVYIFIILILCTLVLISGWILGSKSQAVNKNIPFESGINAVGDARLRFSVKFYLIAMFFVIFDAEALFLYSWSIAVRESGWHGFIEACIFIIVMLISLFYLFSVGAFQWSPKKKYLIK